MRHIAKESLKVGHYYKGSCRNASIARWNGRVFVHWRYKFGETFAEEISCPEDEKCYDVFYAQEELDTVDKEIPLYG